MSHRPTPSQSAARAGRSRVQIGLLAPRHILSPHFVPFSLLPVLLLLQLLFLFILPVMLSTHHPRLPHAVPHPVTLSPASPCPPSAQNLVPCLTLLEAPAGKAATSKVSDKAGKDKILLYPCEPREPVDAGDRTLPSPREQGGGAGLEQTQPAPGLGAGNRTSRGSDLWWSECPGT